MANLRVTEVGTAVGVAETRCPEAGEGVMGRVPSSLNANTALASSEFRIVGEEAGGVWLGDGDDDAVRGRLRPVSDGTCAGISQTDASTVGLSRLGELRAGLRRVTGDAEPLAGAGEVLGAILPVLIVTSTTEGGTTA